MTETYFSASVAETEAFARDLARTHPRGLVALCGELGAGKTAFVRGYLSELLPEARVKSPTYTVMNAYSDEVYHLDLYRITSEEDLESVGFYDLPKDALIFCEWAENLPEDVCPDMKVTISCAPEGRTIAVETC